MYDLRDAGRNRPASLFLFPHPGQPVRIYWDSQGGEEGLLGEMLSTVFCGAPASGGTWAVCVREEAGRMCNRGPGNCWFIGIFAVALGVGILIAAIFPVGMLMFLVACVLIACGLACCKR